MQSRRSNSQNARLRSDQLPTRPVMFGVEPPGVARGEVSILTFGIEGAGLELDDARAAVNEPWPEPLSEAREVVRTLPAPEVPTPDLIEALARQLAWAHGEDPDAQPHPLRYPRWRFYYTRAKALLSISPAEHRALAAVLGGDHLSQPTIPGGTIPHP
jgi:hypothetical protein